MRLVVRLELRPSPRDLVPGVLLVGGAGAGRSTWHTRCAAAALLDVEVRDAVGAPRSSRLLPWLLARRRAGGFRHPVFGNACAGSRERAALPRTASTRRFAFRRKR